MERSLLEVELLDSNEVEEKNIKRIDVFVDCMSGLQRFCYKGWYCDRCEVDECYFMKEGD